MTYVRLLIKSTIFFVILSAIYAKQIIAVESTVTKNGVISSHCLNPEEGQKLYQQIKYVHDVLTAHNIPYTVSSGTLLGLIRHNGIIPWDKDADIQVLLKYKSEIEKLIPIFNKLGYDMIERPFGFKFYAKQGAPVYLPDGSKSGWNFPALDIFFMIVDANSENIVFETEASRKLWPGEYFTHNELYPLKLYKFGPLEVYGPNNPINYLDRSYPGWQKTAIVEVENGLEKKEVGKSLMTNDLKNPAPWTGKLDTFVLERKKDK